MIYYEIIKIPGCYIFVQKTPKMKSQYLWYDFVDKGLFVVVYHLKFININVVIN